MAKIPSSTRLSTDARKAAQRAEGAKRTGALCQGAPQEGAQTRQDCQESREAGAQESRGRPGSGGGTQEARSCLGRRGSTKESPAGQASGVRKT